MDKHTTHRLPLPAWAQRVLHWRVPSSVSLGLGIGMLAVGVILLTIPLWSAVLNHSAQYQAARLFARRKAIAAATTTKRSPQHPLGTSSTTPSLSEEVPAGQVLAHLEIPVIGVNAYVFEGLTFQQAVWSKLLQEGPAHLEGSALPGQPGNSVIFGHVNIWGSVFAHLDELTPGDTITLQTLTGTYVYVVSGSQVVPQTDVSAVVPHGGPPTLQLVTCSGLLDTHRLIVTADLESTASAPSVATVSAAKNLVTRYYGLLADGDWAQAYAMWSNAWRSSHTQAALEKSAPPTQGFQIDDAWAAVGGPATVVVSTENAGSSQPVVTAYTVGSSTHGAVLQSSTGVTLGTPQILATDAPTTFQTGTSGSAQCGLYKVQWTVSPYSFQSNNGDTFKVRTSTIAVDGPSGAALSGINAPALTLGTYPLACGDILGNGSMDLLTRTELCSTRLCALQEPEDTTDQLSVYELGPTSASLVGQFYADGGDAFPQWLSLAPTQPDAMLVDTQIFSAGQRSVYGPAVWMFTAGSFQPVRTPAAHVFTQDLQAEIPRVQGKESCPAAETLGSVSCPFAAALVAYYDALNLGTEAAELPVLEGMLSPSLHMVFLRDAAAVADRVHGQTPSCSACSLPAAATPASSSSKAAAAPPVSSSVSSSVTSSAASSSTASTPSTTQSATTPAAPVQSIGIGGWTPIDPMPSSDAIKGTTPTLLAVAVHDVTVLPGSTRFLEARVDVYPTGQAPVTLQNLDLSLALSPPSDPNAPVEIWQLPALRGTIPPGGAEQWSEPFGVASSIPPGVYALTAGPRVMSLQTNGGFIDVPIPLPSSPPLLILPALPSE